MAGFSRFTSDLKASIRIPYVLRRVAGDQLAGTVALDRPFARGDVALTSVEKLGKNTGLELVTGRRASLHEGDLIAVVFGNRYATHQFEGYARADGEYCDMLSMGGLAGQVASKHASLAEPTRLRLLGAIADPEEQPLRLGDFALPAATSEARPRTIVVCGTSMDSGKTYTTMSIILGLRRQGQRVAGIKLTGTAAGRDVWSMVDAGAHPGLDFVDGGWPSTYLCTLDELLPLHRSLLAHAVREGAEWAVIEVADGLLQAETTALLQSPAFVATVDGWVLAAGEPMAAAAAVARLRGWGIEPLGVSGLVSMSPLSVQETETAANLPCYTARQLQCGDLAFMQPPAAVAAARPAARATHADGARPGVEYVS